MAQAPEKAVSIEGKPRILHYNRKDFDGDPQIWAMCQDKHNILYFGSNNGTLIFDGEKWQKVPLPNNSSVRSLFVSNDGTVYAGGFNEFGRIVKDRYGKYMYESMLSLLRIEDRNIENIWAIHETQNHIVFRGYRYIIAVDQNKAVVLPSAAGMFDYSTVIDDKLFVFDGDGLKTLDVTSLDFSLLVKIQDFGSESFLTLLPGFKDTELLALTRQGTLFSLDPHTGLIAFHKKLPGYSASNRLICAIKSSVGNYYLGTLTTKVVSLSNTGEQNTDYNFFNELQDNTVHSLFETDHGNIWALLNNGIDCIDVSSPVTQVFDNASIADVQVEQSTIYVATNQGVFAADRTIPKLSRASFKNMDGLEGQAWSLQIAAGNVLCGHDQGVVVLKENGYTRLDGPRGVWKIIPVKEKSDHFLVCTYEGIHLMKYGAEGFRILHKLEGFNESSRDILQADQPGVFWVCHGYKGVFKIKIDADYKRIVGVEHFRDKNGLPSPFNINVFKWNNETVFTTNHGIFFYDDTANKFLLQKRLTKVFGTDKNVRQLMQHRDKTWFAHDDEIGYFATSEKDPVLHKGLFLQLKGSLNQSMECIVPVNDHNVLIGTREGLYSFNLNYKPSSDEQTQITQVRYKKDGESEKEVLLPLPTTTAVVEIPNDASEMRFDFAVPGFDDKSNIQYSYQIQEINSTWSEWQETPFVEYTLLPAGKYTFHVKARSLLGERASEAFYSFRITPVWYQTRLAYVLYSVLALITIFLILKLIQHRMETVRRKTITEEEEKRKILQLEIDHIKLEREREEIIKDKAILEEDVIFKSKELANYTMLLVKKRELLSEMQNKLTELKELVKNDQARTYVRDLLKMIGLNLQSEEHLRVFEANFERVHHQFFAALRAAFPDLTNKELQLCAFVKMNLSNKEIASILNLSVRGIETARYRLRKRLGMTHEEDMAAFLEKLHSGHDVLPEVKS